MSISRPSQGTHASDGFRSGPLLQTQYSVSANPNIFPATQLSTPVDTQAPGVFNTPLALHDFIPAPVATAVISPVTAATAPAPFVTVNGLGITVMPFTGSATQGYNTLTTLGGSPTRTNIYLKGSTGTVLKLDYPRNVTVTSSGDDHLKTVTILGWDINCEPMTEAFLMKNVGTAVGNKAFYYIKSVTASANPAGNMSVGVGNSFGLPYFVPNTDYFGVPMWNNIEEPSFPQLVALGASPLTSTNGSSTVVVAVASTAGMIVGSYVTLSGLATTDTLTAANLNITAIITAVVANTSFSYVANGTSTGTMGGGGAGGFYQLVSATPANQLVASAATGDVRGTYTPSTLADGTKRLFLNFYAPSADARKYNDAQQSAGVILNNNPISSTAASTTVTVLAPNHQLTGGELVTISGATSTDATLLAANLNLSNVAVTIVDQNNFTYTATATATSTAAIGGAVVILSPSRGNLYQLPVGRFGVQQF